jgi:ABC-type Fe2+-enterobactin transport system substrate-binding protein
MIVVALSFLSFLPSFSLVYLQVVDQEEGTNTAETDPQRLSLSLTVTGQFFKPHRIFLHHSL